MTERELVEFIDRQRYDKRKLSLGELSDLTTVSLDVLSTLFNKNNGNHEFWERWNVERGRKRRISGAKSSRTPL